MTRRASFLLASSMVIASCSAGDASTDPSGPRGTTSTDGATLETVTPTAAATAETAEPAETPITEDTVMPTTEPPVGVLAQGPEPRSSSTLATEEVATDLLARPRWTVDLAGSTVTAATSTDDLVALAIPDDGLVIALDRATGDERWRYEIPGPVAGIRVEHRGPRIVVRVERPGSGEMLTELDDSGAPVFQWDAAVSGPPNLMVNGDGVYEFTPTDGAERGRFTIDPDEDPWLVGEWVGANLGFGDGLVPGVGADGAVTLLGNATDDRIPTAVVVDPDVESIVYVGEVIVAYDDDRLTAFLVDGTVLWEATYPANPTDVEVRPVAPGSPRFALVEFGVGVSVVDVRDGSVSSTTSWTQAAPYVRDGVLYVSAPDPTDGSVGVLEFDSGTLVTTDSPRGSLRPSETGFVFSGPPSVDGAQRTIWFGRDGAPAVFVDVPAGTSIAATVGAGLFLSVRPGSDGSIVEAFDVPR